ncbi:MAG: class I SAM-dependent methyltransferase [Candidatus Bathyarchaeota archaeon]|nr:MAG: class I SAM-dependent methyltransferase [Candidatus Bathyarchaeota archaeon]
MEKHWTEKLFVDKASIYRPTLEEFEERATPEVEGLMNIFSELGVPEGSLILDLACGIGCHSVLLAEKGFRVVGVDLSPMFIARAEEIAEERGVTGRVEFRVGDMRRIGEVLRGQEGRFGVIVSLFTSLGYYDEETNKWILDQLHVLAACGGILVIDIVNRDWLVRNFQDRDFFQRPDGRCQIMERRLDLETSRMRNVWSWYQRAGEDLEHLETVELDHRVYSLHELKGLVEGCGWNYLACHGGFDSEPFTMDSKRILLIANKT